MIHGFLYDVRVQVSFELEEVLFMMHVASHHYDWKVREMAKQGGTLWGLRNAATWSKEDGRVVTTSMDFSEADRLMKCMEQAPWHYKELGSEDLFRAMDAKICRQLRDVMDKISKRYSEVREVFKSDSYYDRPGDTSDTF